MNQGDDGDRNSDMDKSLGGGPPDEDAEDDEDTPHGVYMKAYCSGVSELL